MAEQNGGEVTDAASPSLHMPVLEAGEDEAADQPQMPSPEPISFLRSYIKDETSYCGMFVITMWFLLIFSLIWKNKESSMLRLGPNCSLLINTNPIFTEYVKVKQVQGTGVPGQVMYGFNQVPPLDEETQWSESHSVYVLPHHKKEWMYVLNEGSQINISYNLNSLPLIFEIAESMVEDNDGLAKWIQDKFLPNITLASKAIHGIGTIQQDFRRSTTYYIGVKNLNSETVKVNLKLNIKNFLYNTTEAYFSCNLAQGACSLKSFLQKRNVAVLTTAPPKEGTSYDYQSIEVSYEHRWKAYLLGLVIYMGGLGFFMILVFCVKYARVMRERNIHQSRERGPTRFHLLRKDNDVASLGSSYDSGSRDGDDSEEDPPFDSEVNISMRRLCVICFDSPRDCFFLPCGHCATCFGCGSRIAEVNKNCSICRRKIKKVKKIYTV